MQAIFIDVFPCPLYFTVSLVGLWRVRHKKIYQPIELYLKCQQVYYEIDYDQIDAVD